MSIYILYLGQKGRYILMWGYNIIGCYLGERGRGGRGALEYYPQLNVVMVVAAIDRAREQESK